jgi:hypothetical protein
MEDENLLADRDLILRFLYYADDIYWPENDCTDRKQLVDQFLKSHEYSGLNKKM